MPSLLPPPILKIVSHATLFSLHDQTIVFPPIVPLAIVTKDPHSHMDPFE